MDLENRFANECFELKEGILYWANRPRAHFKTNKEHLRFNTRHAGTQVGLQDSGGYDRIRVVINGKRAKILAHRIIFLLTYGYLPKEIDHKDLNKRNNLPDNLRPATSTQNKVNAISRRADGVKGVTWQEDRKKWASYIRRNGKKVLLGRFNSQIDAHNAYTAALVELHGEYARV